MLMIIWFSEKELMLLTVLMVCCSKDVTVGQRLLKGRVTGSSGAGADHLHCSNIQRCIPPNKAVPLATNRNTFHMSLCFKVWTFIQIRIE